MKKPGSTSDFTSHRNRELYHSFLHVLRTEREMPLRQMFGEAALRPSPRFWVSEQRAADVIGRMLRGDKLETMIGKRREMFEEIFARVKVLMNEHPELCMTHAVSKVIFQEAPEFYMTPSSARTIIYRMRARARAIHRLRLKIDSKRTQPDE